jgi:hypothetical protein
LSRRARCFGGNGTNVLTRSRDIANRFGAGDYRVSAYALVLSGLRWEVFVTLDEAREKARCLTEK